jgi:hypothetical protein
MSSFLLFEDAIHPSALAMVAGGWMMRSIAE